MNNDPKLEERLRQYARGFRREATPRPNLAESLISGLGERPLRQTGPLSMLPAVSLAAMILVAGIVIALGIAHLRNLAQHPSPSASVTATSPAPTSTAAPSASATPVPSASATVSAAPAPTAHAQPGVVPGLDAIQMVGPNLGWAVGSHGIYATTDGVHWIKQYSSSEQFIGVDFISSTTGWAVGVDSLLGTTSGGRSWHPLGEAQNPLTLRSVHFSSATQGWGIAGGDEPLGSTMGGGGSVLVSSNNGGASWSPAYSPAYPQAVCFTDGLHGWLATVDGTIYRSQDGGHSWNHSLTMASTGAYGNPFVRIECAGPSGLWVDWAPGGAAAGHSPYVVYATTDGQHWRTVMAEAGTIGNQLPGVPAGPGTYPGSFSVVDPSDAAFVGDTPAASSQSVMIATNGGASLKSTGAVPSSFGTFGAAFVSTSTGWVLAQNTNQQIVIEVTHDGGYHWSQQLSVTR